MSSIFMSNDSICEVMGIITPNDFYGARNKIIYKNLLQMYENRSPIDALTFSSHMGEGIKDIGGISYVSEVIAASVTSQNIKSYAQIVKEHSHYRELLKILENSRNKLEKEEASTEEVIEYVQNSIIQMDSTEAKESGEMFYLMDKYMDTLQARYEKGGDIQGLKTGYKALDKLIGGFQSEDLIILAARPSMGKTAVALNIILNSALKEKVKTAFFNLEMGPMQIIDRALSIHSGIPMENIKRSELTDEQWCEVTKAASTFSESNLKIYNKIFKLSGIKSECRKLKIKEGLDFVIIDHLQLIEGVKSAENRNMEVGKITRDLKLMAKELEITVLLVSQLSRGTESRAEHRPMLSDLRDSGSIEQDADVVMFLYRDEYYNKDSDSKGIIECIVSKNRNGGVGTVRLKWKPEIQRCW